MNPQFPWITLVTVALVTAGIFVMYWWFKVFNSPRGEAYQKMRAQGPFAPASEADARPGE
jgi:hypothetical protein